MELKPYLELARVEKPAGFLLVLWPAVWGLTMAAYSTKMALEDYGILLLKTSVAAFIMRAAGCTVNDIFDRNFDKHVARTKNRPLASGRVSLTGAIIFLFLQFAAGIAVFATFNKAAFYAHLIQMFPLTCSYPLMKRATYWPQAWLGLAINYGFVSSWAAVHDASLFQLDLVVYMMTALWCWTMAYDTVYACMDKKDDAKIGVKSTALFFGDNVVAVTSCLSFAFTSLLYVSGVLNNHGLPYYAVCVGGTALFFVYGFMKLDVNSVPSCASFFIQNAYSLGGVIFAGQLLDYLRVTSSLPLSIA